MDMFWPLSATSAPQWMAVLLVMFTAWAVDFLRPTKPASIQREELKKSKTIDKMMTAVISYCREDSQKATDEQKPPEANRLYQLLWDDTHECRTSAFGPLKNNSRMEELFKQVHFDELTKVMERTRRARDRRTRKTAKAAPTAGKMDEAADVLKDLVAHESGEKLNEAIEFAKKVRKNMGGEFIDNELLKQAEKVARIVYYDQSTKQAALYELIRPIIPTIAYCCLASVMNAGLRGTFHQIGAWTEAVETAASGDLNQAYALLFNLWLGHMVIELVQRFDSCYSQRAESIFGQRVRNGVLSAMVRQDYEYFDKTSPGVLQERLNRDAEELGQNLIRFPQRMFHRVTWILVNIVSCYYETPLELFATAMLPLLFLIPLQYYSFR
jgi:ABC-type multidrug transport system fused ATPase/permease subunit